MNLLTPIIHCLVEREPDSFHNELRYAVNLAFEVPSDAQGNVATDEAKAKTQFTAFLHALTTVRFYAYDHAGTSVPLTAVSDRPGSADIVKWLAAHRLAKKTEWFWTSAASQGSVDAEAAGAFPMLRSVQSWNAPVGHRIGLTHLVIIPDELKNRPLVILPHFSGSVNEPSLGFRAGFVFEADPNEEVQFDYDPGLGFEVVGRTTIVDPMTASPLPLLSSPKTDEDGFLGVNKEAEAIYRFLARFEERAPSLFVTNAVLLPERPGDLECVFGIDQEASRWSRTIRFVVARLVTALDTLVIAVMKPGDERSEGELLGPLVSALLDSGAAPDPVKALESVRTVLREHCALIDHRAKAPAIAQALRHIFGIKDAVLPVAPGDLDSLISLMLKDYAGGGDGVVPEQAKAAVAELKDRSVGLLSAQLLTKEQDLSGEAWTEQTLFRLFETAGTTARPFPALLADELGAGPDLTEQAFANFRKVIDGSFNGAEAARRAVGSAFVKALVRAAGEDATLADIRARVEDSDFFRHRLSGSNTPLDEILVGLKPVDLHDLLLDQRLTQAYGRAVTPLLADPEMGRFIPDAFPQPLPIQIASGMGADTLDRFAEAFNGICVAIRRLDNPNSPWAYANLTDLSFPVATEDSPDTVSGALHPFLPGVVDGRSPMFIRYEGRPFSDNVHVDALRADDDDQKTRPQPFYRYQPHAFPNKSKFQKTPQLAYGRCFESFSFAVSKAGTLPKPLQAQSAPWLPEPTIQAPGPDRICPADCSRRTPIAQMAMVERPISGRPARVGESIPGVHPLAADYPRVGALAVDGCDGVIDLFRDGDGHGRMALPETEGVAGEWTLVEFAWSGHPGIVTICLFGEPFAKPGAGGTMVTIPTPAFSSLRIRIERTSAASFVLAFSDDAQQRQTVSFQTDSELCWLRLVLSVDSGTGATATVSLADPDGRRPAAATLPLLLLAPPGKSGTWQPGLSDAVTLDMRTPRVGYADFMRWMGNEDLCSDAYGKAASLTDVRRFHLCLMTAARMRHLDYRLGEYLDRLPDPAVTRILIELHATDRLVERDPDPVVKSLDLRSILGTIVKTVPANFTPDVLINELFKPLDQAFAFSITARSAPSSASVNAAKVVDVIVPKGIVAKLSLHACVNSGHFVTSGAHPPVVHTNMVQFAARTSASEYIFPAGGLRIETMDDQVPGNDDAIRLVNGMLEARAVPGSRRFDIVSKGETGADRNTWRRLGEIDVGTQRWRPSGRPIYHFIDPRQKATRPKDLHVAIPLIKPDREMDLFEREAFFDRSDADAVTVTQRLAPLPAETLLQQHVWDPPSATYFRHRFTLRSRYAGALLTSRTAAAWQQNMQGRAQAWTLRVAMLADRSRLELTRPQLRSVVPLTNAPSSEEGRVPVPPVAAILQEPPFARGGLADRITAEFKTGFGYGFERTKVADGKITSVLPVEILDSRKEIGPNPQLTYRSLDAGAALGLALRIEGPVGLTFDATNTQAPAFPNALFLMRPRSLNGPEPQLQEALAGFAMRRYIDPDWLESAGGEDAPSHLAIDRTWWIDLSDPDVTLCYENGLSGRLGAVLEIRTSPESTSIYARKITVDGVPGSEKQSVEVARIASAMGSALSILHQPSAPGHFSLSVFLRVETPRTEQGDGTAPLLVCSYEWTLPGGQKDGVGKSLVLTGNGAKQSRVRPTLASGATSLKWTQFSKDFDFISIFDSETIEARRVRSTSLRASRTENTLAFTVNGTGTPALLVSSTLTSVFPSHVHRHLAVIASRTSVEPGRPFDVFVAATLIEQASAKIALARSAVPDVVRIVEIETPASILCDNATAAPLHFKQAYFDLLATGYRRDSTILLTVRPVGLPIGVTKLRMLLSQPGGPNLDVGVDFAAKRPLCIRLLLRPVGTTIDAAGGVIFTDGTLGPIKQVSAAFDSGRLGFLLQMEKASAAAGEVWADVSLLHGGTAGTLDAMFDFNWDWLFAADDAGEPAQKVGAVGLSAMVEAQARIISVSPPIAVMG
ncbi:hypothetical protein [Roseomonas indoligenes]|uniref:Uncharacterized protein n=1 Tax=Roseomonas indoligenes TaxID=2820811 RepID=A0A940N3C2_9PROT|nr:hypothetical protein [Pararoseomonas indoligenes]MBP0496005.1 hypothetical protein [Pararoseomonas indoligenes]